MPLRLLRRRSIDGPGLDPYLPGEFNRHGGLRGLGAAAQPESPLMKVRNSLKSLRGRHRSNRLVRRKGRVYVINKVQRRFKARQG